VVKIVTENASRNMENIILKMSDQYIAQTVLISEFDAYLHTFCQTVNNRSFTILSRGYRYSHSRSLPFSV